MRSIKQVVRKAARVGVAATKAKPPCLVCGAADTRARVVTSRRNGRQMTALVCVNCKYVHLPENAHDYTQSVSTKSLGVAPRVGTKNRTGREFGMAQLGVEVLGRKELSVLIYGVGRSLDNVHIGKLSEVGRVAIGDIMKIRDDAEFVDISKPAAEPFDIVVACEVIEHFADPQNDFANLFAYFADDGVLVCSTNINDGHRLDGQAYIFGRGHVSYYSPEALRAVASKHGVRVDFRVPLSGTGPAGPRKRYVIFTRSDAVMDRVSDYFGRHMYAPSESPTITRRRASRPRAAGRGNTSPNGRA
jgi:SAM-dependent methyltransferase